MLYDNAQLPRLYLDAVPGDGRRRSTRRVVEETLDYVLREMRDPAGGFYSATDADSEGEEGKFFVWTPAEVAAVVRIRRRELVCRYWDITDEGNFEGQSIAHLTLRSTSSRGSSAAPPDDVRAAIARARAPPLRSARRARAAAARREDPHQLERPHDRPLAEAGRVLGDRRATSRRPAARPTSSGRAVRRDGRLLHVWAARSREAGRLPRRPCLPRRGAASTSTRRPATAAISSGRASSSTALDAALPRRKRGGYFFTPDDGEALITRSKSGADGALPVGQRRRRRSSISGCTP